MSGLNPEQTQLAANWTAIYSGAGQALDWIAQTRANAPRLDSEADNLNLRLHRARNLAKSLGRVACTPMTVGFFGLSQAGKSYLISALAAGKNGKLQTRFGNETLDFIEHINPVGGGKEATGLVTRFSRAALPGTDPAFPVELKLFSEIEIAKILANAWFKDFDLEQIDYDIDEARIQRILKAVEGRESSADVEGVSADDVVSLWDYLNDNFKGSVKKLQHLYWPIALRLAPRLSIAQRAELFSILWGEQPALTRVYEKLTGALQKLGHCATVFAPLSALVKPDGPDQYSQTDSIMNVDILGRLDTSADLPIDVRPLQNGELRTSASISVAQLAALTTEMTFCLINQTQDPIVEAIDVLDFPGYRGRMKLRNLDTAGGDNMVSQLLLRGKVAYLFERYTDCQEMNALVVCTASDKQSDVPDVGPVLTRWIEKTQGIDSQERSKRAGIGLIWAITMLDKRISGALSTPTNMLDASWEGMIKLTMLERFGTFSWMSDWDGKPFQNTHLVRKPRMETPFIELDASGDELHIKERSLSTLQALGDSFAANTLVNRHIHAPVNAWDELLKINEGGIKRFSQSLNGVATTEFKLARIREQLSECLSDLTTHGLNSWYQSDTDGAMAAKRIQAQMILQQVGRNQAVIGELIEHLQLSSDSVRDLYLSGIYDDVEPAEISEAETITQPASLYGNSGGFDFSDFGGGDFVADDNAPVSTGQPAVAPELQSSEHRFAKAVFKDWIAHLRDLANRQNLLNLLGLNKQAIEAVADELITAGYRHDLPGQLAKAVLKRAQSGSRRDQLVERQVLEVQLVLRDFVSWFGYLQTPLGERPKSLVGAKDHLFAFYSDVPAGQLPSLPAQPANQAKLFFGDWLSGLAALTLGNAGHSAGREITPEQNERLGLVLTAFKAK